MLISSGTMRVVLVIAVCLVTFGGCQLPMGELPTKVTAFVKHAANFATNELNANMQSPHWAVLTDIKHPTIEAAVGIMYRMDLTLKETTCQNSPKMHDATTTTCPPKSHGHVMTCHVEVLDDPGASPRFNLKKHSCQS